MPVGASTVVSCKIICTVQTVLWYCKGTRRVKTNFDGRFSEESDKQSVKSRKGIFKMTTHNSDDVTMDVDPSIDKSVKIHPVRRVYILRYYYSFLIFGMIHH